LDSEFARLYREVMLLRRDVEQIKEMLMHEVSPSRKERRVVDEGREELARGEAKEWSEVRREILS
jgi:hypothetical protein